MDHKTNLLQFSEDEICDHYANLATHIIAAFSNEFKSEEHVKRLKTILNLLAEDKDEVLKCKAGTDNNEKGDIVEAEHKEAKRVETEQKETERVEAERKETESVEAECKKLSVEAEHKGTERVEAECKETERVEAECKETEKVEAEHKETEKVEAECKETERVEAERKKEAEMVEAENTETVEAECKIEELYKENPVDKKERKMDRELYLMISKKDTVSENEGKSKKLVSFSESVGCNIRVATFRFRLNSLCFPCVHD